MSVSLRCCSTLLSALVVGLSAMLGIVPARAETQEITIGIQYGLGDFGDDDRIAVAATSSPQTFLMRMAAEKFFGPGQHGRLDKLLVSMPHPDAMAALLAGRAITGYMASPPFIAALGVSHKGHSVVTTREILGGEEPTGVVLGASRKFIAANRCCMTGAATEVHRLGKVPTGRRKAPPDGWMTEGRKQDSTFRRCLPGWVENAPDYHRLTTQVNPMLSRPRA